MTNFVSDGKHSIWVDDGAGPMPLFEAFNREAEKARLSRQCRLVLERLQRGPATNVELSRICLRFGARLWELSHKYGYRFEKENLGGGLVRYKLL